MGIPPQAVIYSRVPPVAAWRAHAAVGRASYPGSGTSLTQTITSFSPTDC